MANNLMFLVHVPTGLGICLGKRMGYGWYSNNKQLAIQKLFDTLESADYDYGGGKQDDFALAMEDTDGATSAIGFFKYGEDREDGLINLILENDNDTH